RSVQGQTRSRRIHRGGNDLRSLLRDELLVFVYRYLPGAFVAGREAQYAGADRDRAAAVVRDALGGGVADDLGGRPLAGDQIAEKHIEIRILALDAVVDARRIESQGPLIVPVADLVHRHRLFEMNGDRLDLLGTADHRRAAEGDTHPQRTLYV